MHRASQATPGVGTKPGLMSVLNGLFSACATSKAFQAWPGAAGSTADGSKTSIQLLISNTCISGNPSSKPTKPLKTANRPSSRGTRLGYHRPRFMKPEKVQGVPSFEAGRTRQSTSAQEVSSSARQLKMYEVLLPVRNGL